MQDDFDLCLVLNTQMAARAITRNADRRFRPFGITAAQFNILGMLEKNPGRSISSMAQKLAMERTTLSRNLALLDRRGLAEALPDEDVTARIYAITPAGKAVFDAALPEWRQSQSELREAFGEQGFVEIIGKLRDIAKL